MPDYDGIYFDPPAPLERVLLRHPETKEAAADVPQLIDTGADVTLSPMAIVQRLNQSPLSDRYFEVSGFDGKENLTPVFRTGYWDATF